MPSDKHDITVLIVSQDTGVFYIGNRFMNINGDPVVTHKREGAGRDDIKKCHQTLPFIFNEKIDSNNIAKYNEPSWGGMCLDSPPPWKKKIILLQVNF